MSEGGAAAATNDAFGANGSNAGKKAVHVKWAGKTIALGTFPAAEADEKCARAKALTRAWRSTMRPKPTRDWVMLELEKLCVRVVSGRLGRKAGEDGDDDLDPPPAKKSGGGSNNMAGLGISPSIERNGSMGWGNDGDLNSLMNRRTSMGLSMMNDGRRNSLGSLGQVVGLDSVDPTLAHRQLGGGFDVGEAQRRASSLGLGTLAGGGGLGGMGMSVNPNQHYEMLKLHHMNLLNEIQETTLMMNLYQQQQLQQQQQQLQQQATVEGLIGADSQLAMMHQQNGMDPLFGTGKLGSRNSLGLGGTGFGNPQLQMMQHQMMQQNVNQLNMQSMGNMQGNLASNSGVAGATVAASSGTKKSKGSAKATKKKAKKKPIKEEPKVEEDDVDEDDDDDDDDDDEDDAKKAV